MSTASGLPYTDRLWIASAVSAALIVLGSVTTWLSVPTFHLSASGTDGDSDGIITLVLAVAAGAGLLILPRRRSVAAACGLLSLGVATYDVVRILRLGNPVIDIEVGWGLILVMLASIALVITACLGTPMALPARGRAPVAGDLSDGATPGDPPREATSRRTPIRTDLPDVVEPRWDED